MTNKAGSALKLTITPLMALALDGVIGSRRWKDEDDAELFADLAERILLSKAVRESCLKKVDRCPMCSRGESNQLNDEVLEKLRNREIEIGKLEAKKLLTRLKEWRDENGLSTTDVRWYVPLRKALEAIS